MLSNDAAVLWIGRLVVVLEVTDVGPPFSALVLLDGFGCTAVFHLEHAC